MNHSVPIVIPRAPFLVKISNVVKNKSERFQNKLVNISKTEILLRCEVMTSTRESKFFSLIKSNTTSNSH